MKNSNTLDWILGVLLIVGGINWGLIGLFDTNLVSAIFGEGTLLTRIVYILVGISALYAAIRAVSATTTENNRSVSHQ